jgi:mannose-6-phosphate isomerase
MTADDAPRIPLLLEAALHLRVWGGRRLETVMGKRLPPDGTYGESWEVHDTARVADGPFAGATIGDLLAAHGPALIGGQSDPREGFPLLAKLLDADQWLSVQVHPDDEQARRMEGDPRGKTEAWVILAAEPDAQLVTGIRPGTTRAALADAARDGTLAALLVYTPVAAGDVLYLAANAVHAIGPGILLYEIQQASDITYRLYDWGRPGLDGTPRPLHIEKAAAVSNLEQVPARTHPATDGPRVTLVQGPYFQTDRLAPGEGGLRVATDGRFHAVTCIGGELACAAGGVSIRLRQGASALVPAGAPAYHLLGDGVVLSSFQRG